MAHGSGRRQGPGFRAATESGETLKLSKLKGRPVVVYFYPKDDTSGCTAEAKDFTRLAADFKEGGRGGDRHLARQPGRAT